MLNEIIHRYKLGKCQLAILKGSTGSGKTATAYKYAETLIENKRPVIVINMAYYITINDYFEKNNFSVIVMGKNFQKKKGLIILDGLNENKNYYKNSQILTSEINELISKGFKILATERDDLEINLSFLCEFVNIKLMKLKKHNVIELLEKEGIKSHYSPLEIDTLSKQPVLVKFIRELGISQSKIAFDLKKILDAYIEHCTELFLKEMNDNIKVNKNTNLFNNIMYHVAFNYMILEDDLMNKYIKEFSKIEEAIDSLIKIGILERNKGSIKITYDILMEYFNAKNAYNKKDTDSFEAANYNYLSIFYGDNEVRNFVNQYDEYYEEFPYNAVSFLINNISTYPINTYNLLKEIFDYNIKGIAKIEPKSCKQLMEPVEEIMRLMLKLSNYHYEDESKIVQYFCNLNVKEREYYFHIPIAKIYYKQELSEIELVANCINIEVKAFNYYLFLCSSNRILRDLTTEYLCNNPTIFCECLSSFSSFTFKFDDIYFVERLTYITKHLLKGKFIDEDNSNLKNIMNDIIVLVNKFALKHYSMYHNLKYISNILGEELNLQECKFNINSYSNKHYEKLEKISPSAYSSIPSNEVRDRFYGDWGRYTVSGNLSKFLDNGEFIKLIKCENALASKINTVLGEYHYLNDYNCGPYDGRHSHAIERYSKKLQWICYEELLFELSCVYKYSFDADNDVVIDSALNYNINKSSKYINIINDMQRVKKFEKTIDKEKIPYFSIIELEKYLKGLKEDDLVPIFMHSYKYGEKLAFRIFPFFGTMEEYNAFMPNKLNDVHNKFHKYEWGDISLLDTKVISTTEKSEYDYTRGIDVPYFFSNELLEKYNLHIRGNEFYNTGQKVGELMLLSDDEFVYLFSEKWLRKNKIIITIEVVVKNWDTAIEENAILLSFDASKKGYKNINVHAYYGGNGWKKEIISMDKNHKILDILKFDPKKKCKRM